MADRGQEEGEDTTGEEEDACKGAAGGPATSAQVEVARSTRKGTIQEMATLLSR